MPMTTTKGTKKKIVILLTLIPNLLQAKKILIDEIDKAENIDLLIASAKYGHAIVEAIKEAEQSTIH